MVLGSRLGWKIVATFYGSYDKLNCDQLLDVHQTQNQSNKNQKIEFLQKIRILDLKIIQK